MAAVGIAVSLGTSAWAQGNDSLDAVPVQQGDTPPPFNGTADAAGTDQLPPDLSPTPGGVPQIPQAPPASPPAPPAQTPPPPTPAPTPAPGQVPSQTPGQTPGQPPAQPPTQSGNALNNNYVCLDPQRQYYDLRLAPDGSLTVGRDGEQAPGTYTYANGQISLAIPSIGFGETSTLADVARGLLVTFVTPSIKCTLLSHDLGTAVAGYLKCPAIGHIPGVGYQENAFEFFADRSVRWRQWDENTMIADTTYSQHFGTYLIEGEQITMVFGLNEDKPFLSGRIVNTTQLLINELEPERGACKPQ